MAAFASCRRSGWVRVLVVILCALFIFATVATPPAYAVGETAALFTAAAVLSSAVAALGFKLSNDADGIATLNKMVSDFAKEAWALNVLVVGNRINGLIDGINYIKMAVHNGKTYLDERVVAWCQQWLGSNGVYHAGGFSPSDSVTLGIKASDIVCLSALDTISQAEKYFTTDYDKQQLIYMRNYVNSGAVSDYTNFSVVKIDNYRLYLTYNKMYDYNVLLESSYPGTLADFYVKGACYNHDYYNTYFSDYLWPGGYHTVTYNNQTCVYFSGFGSISSENSTGLSGTDTIGADYKDKTLDQILDGLKTWAQDWYDAGADSATNTVAGAKDLPVTVGDQAATANPALNPDVVYNPPFSIPWPGVRSGETSSGAISDGKANADAAQTATTDVAENQTIIDSLVNWALNYINPDTGLFSKFPLCVPYDAYLLVTSSLGVDAVGSDSIFGASPGDLDGVVSQDIETYSDFQPIINIKHDFELDGATYPLELTIDLTPWQPLVTFFREGLALLLVAELIGAEFKRIRGH